MYFVIYNGGIGYYEGFYWVVDYGGGVNCIWLGLLIFIILNGNDGKIIFMFVFSGFVLEFGFSFIYCFG